ncbi:MAG TPA: SpoIID/LytB domain-containing protein [bacterium]|nr:SpoIID/LytB domain-containing protein [bacterium]
MSPTTDMSHPSRTASPPTAHPGKPEKRIRVAILVRKPLVHITAPESFALSGFPLDGTPVVESGHHLYHEATLTPDQLYAHKAFVEPLGDGDIRVDGKSYWGSIEIVEDQKGTLTVINELPLEEYVMGVLAGEIPRNWPLEALKAQAVAARTFAFLNIIQARQKGQSYDLENTSLFQRYQGNGLVNDNIQKAVLQTQGQILTYKSSPILAFFHSNCGGRTSGALEVWSKDQPYLQPVDCPFGNNGEHFRWNADVRLPDLVRNLRNAGLKVADVTGIQVMNRDGSGRITELEIRNENGRAVKMKGSAFRMAVGPDIIRSTHFTATFRRDGVHFSGKGWGHGVGLCQEGAFGMAVKGYKAFEILRHYYRGVMVEKLENYEN